VICLFISCYQAWSGQHASYLAERCKIEKFEKRSSAKDTLASLIDDGNKLIFSSLTKDSPTDKVNSWFADANDWMSKVHNWTKDNLGKAAVSKADDVANVLPMNWDRAISTAHNNTINILVRVKENLNDLMGSSVWDDFDVRVAKSIDACNVDN
jgi:hypothetical protein